MTAETAQRSRTREREKKMAFQFTFHCSEQFLLFWDKMCSLFFVPRQTATIQILPQSLYLADKQQNQCWFCFFVSILFFVRCVDNFVMRIFYFWKSTLLFFVQINLFLRSRITQIHFKNSEYSAKPEFRIGSNVKWCALKVWFVVFRRNCAHSFDAFLIRTFLQESLPLIWHC